MISVKLAQALADPLFPTLNSALRSGRHIGLDELDNHAFLMDLQEYLEELYSHYDVELIHTSEELFYLRPCSTTLIPRSVLSELDMIMGKILCYFYLGLEHLANEGIFTQQELHDELLTLVDGARLLKPVDSRSTGSDVSHQKLREKMRSSFNRLRRLDIVWFLGYDSSKLHITESVFRFGMDVRNDDDLHEAQRRLIYDGETMAVENRPQLNDEPEENQPGSREEG